LSSSRRETASSDGGGVVIVDLKKNTKIDFQNKTKTKRTTMATAHRPPVPFLWAVGKSQCAPDARESRQTAEVGGPFVFFLGHHATHLLELCF
jgi:hypothetical protein